MTFSAAYTLDQLLAMVHLDHEGCDEFEDREGRSADSWPDVIRAGDILARKGGDGFLLVLPGSDSNDARRLVEQPRTGSTTDRSFGVTELAPYQELQACVDRADAELYLSKR